MKKKVFVSYSHRDSDWVRDRLVPCLDAGGAEVLVDYREFTGGRTVLGQMNDTQDKADHHILVLTKAYLASDMCRHEMDRAIARDPTLHNDVVIVVRRDAEPLPAALRSTLWADMRDDMAAPAWELVFRPCGVSLGASAPHWLAVRDEVLRNLRDNASVNLVVDGSVKWEPLIHDVGERLGRPLPRVDLSDGAAESRQSLVTAILRELGVSRAVDATQSLAVLSNTIKGRGLTKLCLTRFQWVKDRTGYDKDLHGALRFLAQGDLAKTGWKLVLLVQSRGQFAEILPGSEYSSEDFLRPIRLIGHGRMP